jgi:predicted DNA binding protein
MSITHVNQPRTEEPLYKQVELELRHSGCWTLAVTDACPGTHVIEKSLYPTDEEIKGDFILVSEGATSIGALLETIDEHSVVNNVAVLKRSADRARVVINYRRDSSIVPKIVNSEFMPIEPVHITDGWEYWTVLVRSDAISRVVRQMKQEFAVDVNAIHAVDPSDDVEFADIVDCTYSDLSTRQRESLFEAHADGYYQWSRNVSSKHIDNCFDIIGPTLLEHLRIGEQKILNAVLEEMQRRFTRYRSCLCHHSHSQTCST